MIAPRPLTEFVPLYKSQKDDGEITTQWAMKEIERVGLLKMDFLGLSTLTLLDDAVKHIEETEGIRLDLAAIPMEDAGAYQIFQSGQTHGVFQFESSGMREMLRKAKPQCLEDLIALNALYRPGPLRGGVVDDYIARKHGRVEIKYDVPQMESVLKDTYGVIAYQEQVMRLASELAGFTLGQADELRRAMGKKDAAKMAAKRAGFVDGCKANNISEKKATKIFEFIEYFAGYGFPKAHSTTYALLAYQTAYLKANYPRHFMAALLTIESQSSDKVALYLAECRELAVPVLPADINTSQLQFAVEPDGVRFGLGAVKGAGEGAIASILETRQALGGRISSIFELAEHIDLRLVNKKVLESLIKAGAFDSLAPGGREGYLAWRPRLIASLDRILDHGNRHQRDRDQGQELLFGGDAAAETRHRRRVGLAAGPGVDGNGSADVREGGARPLHVRAPAPALCGNAGCRRRATARRPHAVGSGLQHRRHRDRVAAAQDQARRSHGGVHARGRRRQGRSRRLPGCLREVRRAGRR